MKKAKIIPILVYTVVLVLLFTWLLGMFSAKNDGMTYSDILRQFQEENVSSFQVNGNTITMQLQKALNGKTQVSAKLADPEGFHQQMHELFLQQTEAGILKSYDFLPEDKLSPYDFIPVSYTHLTLPTKA